jgi:tetratricopeptide (TPR) repeat protein
MIGWRSRKVMTLSNLLRPVVLAGLLTSLGLAQTQAAPQDQKAPRPKIKVVLPQAPKNQDTPNTPPQSAPEQRDQQKDTTKPAENAASPSAQKLGVTNTGATDRAQSYYHFGLAHMYEELAAMSGRSEYANRAIEEYRQAIQNDPQSDYLNAGIAELYFKTGRIRDAVMESQEVIKRDPANLEARKLLGRIYLRSLGDPQGGGSQSQEMLNLAIQQFTEIVKLEPNNPDNHLLLGRLYILNKDLLRAEEEFKAARGVDPTSEEAVSNLAYLYNEEGDAKKAIATLNSLPEEQRSAKLYSILGYTYEQQHDYKNAIRAYKKAVDLDKDNLDAIRGMAQNLLNDGQTEAALAQYQQVIDADPQDAQAYLRISDIYRRQGKFDAALDMLNKADSLMQDLLEVPYNKALIFEAQGKYDESIQLLQGLVEKSTKPAGNYSAPERNNRAVFLERLGSVYRETGKTQLAVDTFRKLLDLGDENAERGYQQLVDTYREAKQWSQATEVAQEAVKKMPNDKSLKLVLAGQLADNGQADQGVAQAKALLKGKPEDREVYVALAQMHTRLKRWKDAEEALDNADRLSTKPDDKQAVLFLRGSAYERQKKYDLAEEVFRKILTTDPSNAMVLNYLGYMLADRGVRVEEALAYIKKAVDQEPQNGAYLDSLGWAYFKLNNMELAEENLRKASERIPNDPTVHQHLGDVYQKTGRLRIAAAQWERAIDEWNRSVPADVDNDELARVQKALESAKVKLAKQQAK